MRPNAVPTTKNLKLLHVAWEKIRMYLYIRRLYAYNKSIGSIAKQFQDSCLWIYVCQFSVYKHNMINYVDYVLLGNAWTSLKKYRKSEICKTLDTFQPHALLSQMYLDHKALPQKKHGRCILLFMDFLLNFWTLKWLNSTLSCVEIRWTLVQFGQSFLMNWYPRSLSQVKKAWPPNCPTTKRPDRTNAVRTNSPCSSPALSTWRLASWETQCFAHAKSQIL